MNDSTKTLSVYERNDDILEKCYEINFIEKQNVLELLNSNGIKINQSCGGFGTCTTCKVYILNSGESQAPERNTIEKEIAEEKEFKSHERLACQLDISENLDLEIAYTYLE